jgi:hypothetical protein
VFDSELIAIYSRRNCGFSCGNFHFSGWNNDDSAFRPGFASGTEPLPAGIAIIPAGTKTIPMGMGTIPAGTRLAKAETQHFLPASGQFLPEWK